MSELSQFGRENILPGLDKIAATLGQAIRCFSLQVAFSADPPKL